MPDKNKIILGTNDDTYIAADDAGNIVLQHEQGQRVALTDSAIEPATDETLDLGSATNKFKDLYLSSDSIYIGNTKLSSDPTTGALSTVVANEQGEFTDPAAPVGGGGEASAFDWEGEGYTYMHAPLLARTDQYELATQHGTLNYWDPIETFKYSQANPSLMPYNDHYNQSRPGGGTAYSAYYNTAPTDNWQMTHLGGQSSVAGHESLQLVYLMNEAEADANVSSSYGPPTLFKDSNDKYFYDFIKESFKKYKTDSLALDMVFEVTYTCSDAATAANTPFFERVTPDSDGVYRRTFFKAWMKDKFIAPKSFFAGNTVDGLEDLYIDNIIDWQLSISSNTRNAWQNYNTVYPTGNPVWAPYNNEDAFLWPFYGYGRTLDATGEQAHCYHQANITFGTDVTRFNINPGYISWASSFFENGSLMPPAAGQTSNEGRGCERTFKVKIKQ